MDTTKEAAGGMHPSLFVFGRAVGSTANVQTQCGSVYRGILHSIDPTRGDIYLRMAYLVNDAQAENPFVYKTPAPNNETCIKELCIEWTGVGQVQLPEVDISVAHPPTRQAASAAARDDFTDSAIAGTGRGPATRSLKRWTAQPGDDSLDDTLEECGSIAGGWSAQEMLRANKEKFGIDASFDESQYTTSLDTSKFTKAEKAAATKLAQDITKGRNKTEGRQLTDDEKYSWVDRSAGGDSAEAKQMPPSEPPRAPAAKHNPTVADWKRFSESVKVAPNGEPAPTVDRKPQQRQEKKEASTVAAGAEVKPAEAEGEVKTEAVGAATSTSEGGQEQRQEGETGKKGPALNPDAAEYVPSGQPTQAQVPVAQQPPPQSQPQPQYGQQYAHSPIAASQPSYMPMHMRSPGGGTPAPAGYVMPGGQPYQQMYGGYQHPYPMQQQQQQPQQYVYSMGYFQQQQPRYGVMSAPYMPAAQQPYGQMRYGGPGPQMRPHMQYRP